jgi:ABC-type multidrug transport system fused ATPase/permease subunit
MNLLFASGEFGSGSFLLGMLYIFMFVIWFWLLISIFSDLFARHDVSGWTKAFWILFVIIIPMLGILMYFITQGHGMATRGQERMQQAQQQMRQEVGFSSADELEKLKKLHDAGTLSDAEYSAQKAKVLS